MPQINKPTDYFNTVLYSGTSAEQSISSLDYSPDFVWVKDRGANSHRLFDSVRGATKLMYSDLSYAEATDAQTLKSFDSNGFTLGTNADVNGSGQSFVSWNWRGSDSSPATNTDGSITSSVSASTTSGFSIVSYTGNGSAGATIGHGLGSTPSAIFVKRLDDLGDWGVYHSALGNTNYLRLNTTGASASDSTYWNNTSPTSSVFTVGTITNVNGSGSTHVAYCFAEKKGFSKAFSYTGNGSTDGTFTYLGFRPAMVILKRTDSAALWYVHDNKRNTFNPLDKRLYPSSSAAEATPSPGEIDYLSNGFKLRTTEADINASGGSYIGIAFAEFPLVSTAGVPTCAR